MVAAKVEFLAPDDDSALHSDEAQQRWATNFSGLCGDQASSDCTIEVGQPHRRAGLSHPSPVSLAFQIGDVSIPAHKFPLIANSPVFRAMFINPAAEEFHSSVVKITDFKEPEPMRAILRYCYQGRLDDATMEGEWTVEIFKLADRYCIADLKALLETHFIDKRLRVGNAVAMAVLADMHSANKLKKVNPCVLPDESHPFTVCASFRPASS
jgi:hypothetical protein